jgi:ketosteroid isomerase-like protein
MNAECIAASFVSNGTIYDTGLLQAKDSDGIHNYLDQSFSTNHIDSLASTIDSITINGTVAVVIGTYDEKTSDTAGQSSEAKLQYVAEWIQQSNGQWLLNRLSTVISP